MIFPDFKQQYIYNLFNLDVGTFDKNLLQLFFYNQISMDGIIIGRVRVGFFDR